jgi:hypothetical protein
MVALNALATTIPFCAISMYPPTVPSPWLMELTVKLDVEVAQSYTAVYVSPSLIAVMDLGLLATPSDHSLKLQPPLLFACTLYVRPSVVENVLLVDPLAMMLPPCKRTVENPPIM